ncbi:MAG: hypothetical protein AB1578_13870 [Thermodesulfobacteriota bacterium]
MDLERDLPTTPEDVDALRRASTAAARQEVDYLAFLSTFGETSPERLRARRGPRGNEPFELPALKRPR